jgi:hypothetical protein
MSFQISALLATWIAIVLLALVVSGLIRQVVALSSGRVQVRAGQVGLPEGTPAPDFARLAPQHVDALALLFVSEDCGVCEEILEEVAAAPAGTVRPGVAVRAVFGTTPPAPPRPPSRNGSAELQVLVGEGALFERYRIPVTPFAVMVDAAGRVVRSEPVGSRQALHAFLDRTIAARAVPVPVLSSSDVSSRREVDQ